MQARKVRRPSEAGQGLVEYALLLFLVAAVVVVSLMTLGRQSNRTVNRAGAMFATSTEAKDGRPEDEKGGNKDKDKDKDKDKGKNGK
jgi:Flp pilus assembly pilin Flp